MRSFRGCVLVALALAACGGNDNNATTAATSHTVGGTLTGLSGTIVLANNGGDDLTLTQDGAFTFATAIAQGDAYDVAVKTPPAGQTCAVANGSNTMGDANVTNVTVTCTTNTAPTHTVGGTLSDLSGTVVLTNNGGDDLTLTQSGPFTFATEVAEGAAYDVAVKTQPAGQTCTVADGSGTLGSANVTNVTVTCADNAGASPVITSFVFEAANSGGLLTSDAVGVIGGSHIAVPLPNGTAVTSLTPTITTSVSGATVSPASGAAQDFTQPVDYTVSAGGSGKTYAVSVSTTNKNIILFSIDGVDGTLTTGGGSGAGSVALALPCGTDLTSRTPIIGFTGVSVDPASGAAQDFTNPVTYTVTGAGISGTKQWTVTVTAPCP